MARRVKTLNISKGRKNRMKNILSLILALCMLMSCASAETAALY